MKIRIAEGESEKGLRERVLMNLKAGKEVDSETMAWNMRVDKVKVETVMDKLISEGKAKKVLENNQG